MAQSRYYLRISFQVSAGSREKFIQNSRCSISDPNSAPSKYQSELLQYAAYDNIQLHREKLILFRLALNF